MPRGGRSKQTCPSCKAENVKVKHGYCPECIPSLAAQLAEQRRSSHAERTIRKYGMTPELHAELFFAQNGVCAICRNAMRSRKIDGQRSGLVVDHNHLTGEVRGLLCQSCNLAIGLMEDKRGWLRQASQYVTPKKVDRKRAQLRKVEGRRERLNDDGPPSLPTALDTQIERLRRELALREEIQDRTKT